MILFILNLLIFTTVKNIFILPKYELFFYNSYKDHLSTTNSDTFPQRYLIINQYYFNNTSKSKSNTHTHTHTHTPIFFFLGGEGDIINYYKNSGFLYELGDEFQALIIFIEHRYYGKSFPDNNNNNYEFLNSEQALNDFVEIVKYVKYEKYQFDEKSSVIVFGGSYSGMMASYMRIKYPHIIDGALSSSAPNMMFEGYCDPSEFSRILTRTYANSESGCDEIIRNGFLLIDQLRKEKTFELLSQKFKVCESIKSENDVLKLIDVIEYSINGLALVNYPTPSTFLQPLPEWPVKLTCKRVIQSVSNETYSLLDSMFQILDVYYNYTGNVPCIHLDWVFSRPPFVGNPSWDFQRCSEFIMPMESNGITDFLLARKWVLKDYVEECKKNYPKVHPKPYWILTNFHSDVFRYVSNIIFSNGNLDPWASCGIKDENVKTDKIHIISIIGAAHHVDLRFSSDKDPEEIQQARNKEKEIIKSWIEEK